MTTDLSEGSFVGEWPELERRLQRALARKSVKPWLRDDIVQETGLRLFKIWDDVDPSRGPWPLALTIATNLLSDERNRRQKREVLGLVPEAADNHNVERSGIARLELGRIKRALATMNHNYRSILLAEVGHPIPLDGDPRAVNMLRMRARRSLTQALARGREAVGALPIGWRRFNAWFQSQFSPEAQMLITPATAVVTAVSFGLLVLIPPDIEPQKRLQGSRRDAAIISSREERGPTIQRRSPGPALRPVAPAPAAPAASSATQTDPPPPPQQETTVETGQVNARSGEGKGYRYVAVRTGDDSSTAEDDSTTCVTIATGSHSGSEEEQEEEDPCS